MCISFFFWEREVEVGGGGRGLGREDFWGWVVEVGVRGWGEEGGRGMGRSQEELPRIVHFWETE